MPGSALATGSPSVCQLPLLCRGLIAKSRAQLRHPRQHHSTPRWLASRGGWLRLASARHTKGIPLRTDLPGHLSQWHQPKMEHWESHLTTVCAIQRLHSRHGLVRSGFLNAPGLPCSRRSAKNVSITMLNNFCRTDLSIPERTILDITK